MPTLIRKFLSAICLPITFSKFICETKELLNVGWKLSASMLLECALSTNSVLFVGRHDKTEKAAVSFADLIITTICILPGFGIVTVCNTYISNSNGEQLRYKQEIILQKALLLCIIISLLICPLLLNMENILILLYQDPEISFLAGRFCMVYIAGVPILLWSLVLSRFLQCRGHVCVVLIMLAFTVAVNFLLNYIFIIVLDGGLRIAAAVLVVSQYIYFLMLVVYFYWNGEITGVFMKESLENWYDFSVCVFNGFLLFIFEQLNLAFGFFLCGLVGAKEVDVFALFDIIVNCTFMITSGFSTAMSIKIGEKLGVNEHAEAKTLACVDYIFTLIYNVVVFLILIVPIKYVGRLFTDDMDVILELSNNVIVIAIHEVTDITSAMLDGILEACGRQCVSSSLSLLSNIISIPAAIYVAFALDKITTGL
ncbi:multidrug and toxin extrusion protein 2-like [Anneissia japonica]|uniref:multidrug and toxin extrusion protein 2-like n=1 Tax=Anneissia japonica TaxID=1529436 RepID=UPI001425A7A1|nr:multidrug and toxin extrusion protein 2-like [Anneissia japonica]